MPIKVLAFDLDDTLWDMRPTLLRAEKVLIAWLTENCSDCSFSGQDMRQVREQLLDKEPGLAVNLSELRTRVISETLIAADYPPAQAASYAEEAFQVFFEARNQVAFFDGAIDSLDSLHNEYVLGSLTNGNADIDKLGLSHYFSFAFSAADVGSPKPAPDLFVAALKHTGVDVQEMIYIGDHPLLDMDAAKKLGINTIWINLSEQEFDGSLAPDQQITHLGQLPKAVYNIDVA
jgi:putative hydrolase of the HAD superfamily